MQDFGTLRQPLLGELAMSWRERRKREREKNAIYSGHLRLCQHPRAAHALRSDQQLLLLWYYNRLTNQTTPSPQLGQFHATKENDF